MIDPRMSRFWRLALQSDLIDDRGLSQCWESIPPDRRDSIEQIDRRLARQAIQLNFITLWQAQQLLAGRFNGFKVGRYILLDLIGQGGMGRVYLARDSRLGRTVALKILSADRMKNLRAIARFQREARVGAQLQHENLVRMYDFGESDGRHYLVMEYIEGRTIGSLIAQQGPIPPAVAAGLGRQVALGLEHAYKKGLVHRDVNPYNIMVTYDGTAKLADLGLALDLSDNDRFTRDGATVGTFDYVSPEQARHSHSVDIRSDIYSLGCTLYHMIAGEVPFPTASLAEKLFAHQSHEPTPLRQLVPSLPQGLAQGIEKMMRKSPDERFSTPLQVAQMLEPFTVEPSDIVNPTRGGSHGGIDAQTRMIPRYTPHTESELSKPYPDHSENQTAEVVASNRKPLLPQTPVPTQGSSKVGLPTGNLTLSDLDLALMVDLGPEPSLSEVLAESRTLPRSRHSPTTSSGILTRQGRIVGVLKRFGLSGRRGAMLSGLLAFVSAGAFIVFYLSDRSSPAPGTRQSGTQARPSTPSFEPKKPTSAITPPITPSQVKPETPSPASTELSPFVVRSFDGNSQDIPINNLSEAISRAVGSRGMVVIRSRKPLVLTNAPVIQLNLQGKLLICAEKGIEPKLEVTLSRPGPFLRSGTSFSLEIEGITIRAKSTVKPAGSSKPMRSAIIQAAGPVTLRRCDFKFEGSAEKSSSVAVLSDGASLSVERSRFEGFDRAIEIDMYRKIVAAIRQTMIVSPAEPSGASQTAGLKISHIPLKGASGNTPGLQLLLDRCSFRGTNLMVLAGFSERAPLHVNVSNCDVQAESLVHWDMKSGNPMWSKQALPWVGAGNRYTIRGPWLRTSSIGTSTKAASDQDLSVDASSWAKNVEEIPSTSGSAPGADPRLVGASSPDSFP